MAEYSIFRHDIPELLSLMFAVHTLQDALLSHHEGHYQLYYFAAHFVFIICAIDMCADLFIFETLLKFDFQTGVCTKNIPDEFILLVDKQLYCNFHHYIALNSYIAKQSKKLILIN